MQSVKKYSFVLIDRENNMNFLEELQQQKNNLKEILLKIENEQAYVEELKAYLPLLNATVVTLFEMIQNGILQIDINLNFVLGVLNDVIYGIEQEDIVYLEDVLRYGLMEIYDYIEAELQSEDYHE